MKPVPSKGSTRQSRNILGVINLKESNPWQIIPFYLFNTFNMSSVTQGHLILFHEPWDIYLCCTIYLYSNSLRSKNWPLLEICVDIEIIPFFLYAFFRNAARVAFWGDGGSNIIFSCCPSIALIIYFRTCIITLRIINYILIRCTQIYRIAHQ